MLRKLPRPKEFAELCKRYGVSVDAQLPRLAAEVKRVKELADYENFVGNLTLIRLDGRMRRLQKMPG
jgi:hypothetical protein